MALLVNYEGTYLPPQKLWYLIDGVWTEVKQVFENNAQNELALLDQERIKQDQVVTALQTRVTEISAKLNGSDITIPIETDPLKINSLNKEIELLNLQLNVAKTEQVVMTKSLFEQKAQLEYIKLIGEGEKALSKIASIVANPVEWLCIRIAPQSTLDERLELAIQHGLPDDSRIFNYGLVYYRLYKVNSTSLVDDLEYLKTEFKRRLSKEAFNKGIEPTNYILTVDSIQNIYLEVNQFVNSGAKRIEDYLANIKEQQKFILDEIEKAKESMKELEVAVTEGLLPVNETGQILTKTALTNLQVPLGEKLLAYQNVTSFDQLVSTKVLDDIVTGTASIENFPGIIKLNQDANSLTEKIEAIKDFQNLNNQIQTDLTTGVITFNLNVLSTKKVELNTSKTLFWSTPLGNSTISNSGGTLTYQSTYTSSGAYKFKVDELVKLDTKFEYIINAILTNTKLGTLGVTIGNLPEIKIIQSIKANTIELLNKDIPIDKSTTFTPIVSQQKINTKIFNGFLVNYNTSDFGRNIVQVIDNTIIDEQTGIAEYLNCVKVNDKDQLHPEIPFVDYNNTYTIEWSVKLDIEHPVINSLFYPNIVEYPINNLVKVTVEPYLYEANIRQLNKETVYDMVKFNCKPEIFTKTDFQIISYISNSISDFKINPIKPEKYISDEFVISCISNSVSDFNILPLNTIPNPISRDYIVSTNFVSDDKIFKFNLKEEISALTTLDGYAQKTDYKVIGASNGIIEIQLTNDFGQDLYNNYATIIQPKTEINKNIDISKNEHVYLASQTGLKIEEIDKFELLNAITINNPKICIPTVINISNQQALSTEYLNLIKTSTPIISSEIKTNLINFEKNLNNDKLNVIYTETPLITTQLNIKTLDINLDIYNDKINKDVSKIPFIAEHLNPGVILN